MADGGERARGALARDLAAWLGHEAGVGDSLKRLSGGESSECYRFELPNPPSGVPARLVLRLMRNDRVAARECAIQNAVEAVRFPVPRIFRVGTSASAFARPFSIMAFVEGRDPVADGSVRRVPEILAETMRALHVLPADSIRASVTSAGVDVRQVDVVSVIDELRRSERTEIARSVQWFGENSFDAADAVLCHGDLHARNLLMGGGRVVAVLDWEIAVFAPRAYDVARTETLLMLMPGIGSAPLRPFVRLLGRRVARQFVSAYVSQAPIDGATLDRCRALHALRLVALVRSAGMAADGVRRLWRPFERELSGRWEKLTGVALSR